MRAGARMRAAAVVVASLVGMVVASPAPSGASTVGVTRGWTQQGGSIQHAGLSAGTGPQTSTALWSANLAVNGCDSESPAIGPADNIAIICGNVLRVLTPTGKTSWSWTLPRGSTTRTTPAFSPDGSSIYLVVAQSGGQLLAIDTKRHVLRWQTTKLDLQAYPVVGPNGTIYVQGPTSHVIAVSPQGVILWKFNAANGLGTVGGSIAMSPDGSTIYAGSGAGILYALKTTGSLRWSAATSAPAGSAISNSPAVGPDGTVYVATAGPVWNTPSDIDAFSPTGTMLWHATSSTGFAMTPSLTATGLVVAANFAGQVIAVHQTDGSLAWTFDAPPLTTGNGFDAQAASSSNGITYIANPDDLFAFNDADGSVLWTQNIDYGDASPALDPVRGVLIASTGTGLVEF